MVFFFFKKVLPLSMREDPAITCQNPKGYKTSVHYYNVISLLAVSA
jgi:hypothetical protein